MSPVGPSRHVAAVQQYGCFRSEADIGLGGSQASQKRTRIYFGSHLAATYGYSALAGADFKNPSLKGAAAAEVHRAACEPQRTRGNTGLIRATQLSEGLR
jgi:hypothetical protein